jgi:hypothetical protein
MSESDKKPNETGLFWHPKVTDETASRLFKGRVFLHCIGGPDAKNTTDFPIT